MFEDSGESAHLCSSLAGVVACINVGQADTCAVDNWQVLLPVWLLVRLIHLQEGSSRRCREIVRLLDIRSIEQRQELSVTLKQRPALRITFKGIVNHLGIACRWYDFGIKRSKVRVRFDLQKHIEWPA